jgi:hypothetical protein
MALLLVWSAGMVASRGLFVRFKVMEESKTMGSCDLRWVPINLYVDPEQRSSMARPPCWQCGFKIRALHFVLPLGTLYADTIVGHERGGLQ